ncbi:MAG: hypothetical protein K0S65_2545 [Labilithrix sp.]|nr:hypothetical protein [Labilithrix sp.]
MRPTKPTLLLLASLAAAVSSAALLNCAAPEEEEEAAGEDAVTGVNNTLGLGLVYDSTTSKVKATLKKPLATGERLFIRVRRGTITHESQKELDCGALTEATPITKGDALSNGKTLYDGPSVSKELVDLLSIYNDERWYGGNETPQMRAEVEKGPDAIVEACVLSAGKVRAKLLTNLAYAWDRGEDLKKQTSTRGRSIHFLAGDGGVEGEEDPGQIDDGRDGGADAGPSLLPEGPAYNTIDYANLCTQELGEIPFFKKLGDGKYETFDCRDFVGSDGDQAGGPIDGVEGSVIPLTVDDEPQTECSDGRTSSRSYDCVDKCDRGMWLTASSHTGLGRKAACQPGVTVTTAKNAQGSHWVLLCRKVDNSNGDSMMKTKVFNDIAIIGRTPRTGKTCFFQNKENIGNDGSRVTHPGDVARSSAIWPATPSSYCTKNCHAADAFVHSPWIDQALHSDGKTIVPKMGETRDFPISNFELPYKLINGPAQGFQVPQQLVSEDVAPCTTCHRVAGAAFAEFAEWSTGEGDAYFGKITDRYKAFEKSHWMPLRLEGLTAENFPTSKWGVAVKHIRKCMDNTSAEGCEFADVPQQ